MRKIFFVLIIIFVILRCIFSFNSPYEGKRIRLNGTLLTDPKEYGTSLLVNLSDYSFFVPQNENISYGSKIIVEGIIKKGTLEKVKVIKVYPATSILSFVRAKILSSIRSTLPEPESSLLAGATIGAPNIPKDFNESLRATGTSHIVVASGGNLAILAGFLESVFARVLKRKIFLPLTALILLIYCILTGFSAPVIRGLVMWLILMAAQLFGRNTKPVYVLFLTILLMLLFNPQWIKNVSFQLSVGATAGILILSSKIQKKLTKIPIVNEALSTSIAAQIGTLPVSIFVFHDIKLLSPLWNVLVLWTVPFITILGMIGSVLVFIFEPLGKFIFLMSYPFGWYFTNIISLSS